MNLSDLEVFRAVANEGGIVKAARKLHRVPSNVTKRIQQLEATLGAPLFVRARQRLFVSPHGELLLSYANRLLQLADEARAAVSGVPPRGTLRLGSLESTSASRFQPSLGIGFGQAQNPKAGTIAHLRVRLAFQDVAYDLCRRFSHTLSPMNQP